MTDTFDLQRFVDAQGSGVYDCALAELRSGRKRSHWIWFVLPQIAGLGNSPQSIRFALSGPREARAYLAHPVLGPRLIECMEAIEVAPDIEALMGSPIDVMKLHSCASLFLLIDPREMAFHAVLARHYGWRLDAQTMALLAS
jgi:uncharacterized protein (DUF1810 family)